MTKRYQSPKPGSASDKRAVAPGIKGGAQPPRQSAQGFIPQLQEADGEKANVQKAKTTGKEGGMSLLAGFASILAIVSVLTSLFGYGVVTGLAHSFGHSQETVFNSGFDLITMVWPGVVMILTSLEKVLSLDLLIQVWDQTRVPILAVGCIVFLVTLAVLSFRSKMANTVAIRASVKEFFNKKRPLLNSAAWALLSATLSMGITFLLQVLGAVSVMVLFVLAVYVPSLGFVIGKAYVDRYVVAPSQCAPPSGRALRLNQQAERASRSERKESLAECVIISSLDPTKPFFRAGRTVLSSSSAMLVWNADSGQAHRTPLAGMDVTSIDETTFKQMSKLLARYPAACLSPRGATQAHSSFGPRKLRSRCADKASAASNDHSARLTERLLRSLSEILCVRHSMSIRSMNATQDQENRPGGPGGAAANSIRVA